MQSLVFKMKRTGELTQPCGPLQLVTTGGGESVVYLDQLSSVTEKLVIEVNEVWVNVQFFHFG